MSDVNSIQIKNLVKEYKVEGKGKKKNSVKAVDGLSFDIKKGEIFGFLGPNGAGKTTTINCICQLSTITSGTIIIEGFNVKKDYLDAKMQVGLSPQDIQFDPLFKIIDVLTYQAGYFGMPKKEAIKRAEQLLKDFNLYDKRNQTMRQLSGGMKRKFSIIKALVHNPKVLILDEPTAALDVDSRYEMWDFIKNVKKQGITIILTTHYIEEAEKLSDRIAIINKGKLIKLDKTEKIIDDLSQNIISIYLDEHIELPKELEKYSYKYDDKKLDVTVSKQDQSKCLRELLQILEKYKIEVRNFNVDQDNLENIFRRLVKDSK